MTKNFAITLSEYDRIFRVVHSVSEGLDDRVGASCLFYNTIGALLIENSLKVKAWPVMGAAFFRVNDATDTVLSFSAFDENDICISNPDAFHCWVETQDHVIDFTAPVYQKYFDKMGMGVKLPNKMFQKKKTTMSPSWRELYKEGDYFIQEDRPLTTSLRLKALETPAISDLANVCLYWFKRPPKKISESMSIMNDLGEVVEVNLATLPIIGSW